MMTWMLIAASLAQPATGGAVPTPASGAVPETLLDRPVQLTFRDKFVKAGEAYFDHASPPKWVIFQAVEVASDTPSAPYAMYIAELKYEGGKPVGLNEPVRISKPGSSNTCGWFHPSQPIVIFASTWPSSGTNSGAGYQRGTNQYRWSFPPEMRIFAGTPEPIRAAVKPGTWTTPIQPSVGGNEGYTAECSLSGDGQHLLFTHVDPKTADPDIWVTSSSSISPHSKTSIALIKAKGYDGGAFFSPDAKWICYRSDRRGDNNLQLFLAELVRRDTNDPARITGIAREVQLTNDADVVNWAPYWHPSGEYLVYASSQMGHRNYEVFAIDVRPAMARAWDAKSSPLARVRVTTTDGFDGLPAFSDDGKLMMWTSQRAGKAPGEERPSSQLWIASWHAAPGWTKGEKLPDQHTETPPAQTAPAPAAATPSPVTK